MAVMGYFLDKLRQARIAAKISQSKAGEVIGVTRENFNSFERGRRPIGIDKLKPLLSFLGIPEPIWKAWLAIDEFGADALVEAYHILHPEHPKQA